MTLAMGKANTVNQHIPHTNNSIGAKKRSDITTCKRNTDDEIETDEEDDPT